MCLIVKGVDGTIKKRETTVRVIVAVLLAVTLVFIVCNSLFPVPLSDAQSSAVVKAIKPALRLDQQNDVNLDGVIRKLAHVWEFAALGTELGVLAVLRRKHLPARLGVALACGLFAGLVDETVQIFSHRGPEIQDVWLDGLGVLLGLAAVMLLYGAVRLIRRRKNARQLSR